MAHGRDGYDAGHELRSPSSADATIEYGAGGRTVKVNAPDSGVKEGVSLHYSDAVSGKIGNSSPADHEAS